MSNWPCPLKKSNYFEKYWRIKWVRKWKVFPFSPYQIQQSCEEPTRSLTCISFQIISLEYLLLVARFNKAIRNEELRGNKILILNLVCVSFSGQNLANTFRSSCPEVFLKKGVQIICSKFIGEHPCRSVISIKLLWNRTSAWLSSCKFAAYFQNTLS